MLLEFVVLLKYYILNIILALRIVIHKKQCCKYNPKINYNLLFMIHVTE